MKSLFSEYYNPSKEEYDAIWENALIVFDTNILLDLYRYPTEVSSDFISVMKFYSNRLWLPHQIAWEFHRNRIGIIVGQIEAYNQLSSRIENEIQKAIEALKKKDNLYLSHPYIKFNTIEQSINKKVDLIKKSLIKQQQEYPINIDNDNILKEVTILYTGKVGSCYCEADFKTICSDAKKRYEHKVPPGYCDEDEKKGLGEQQLYGDVILWNQILDKSKAENKSIIFVCNEVKEDWILKIHGKNISARKELIKEFNEKTGQKILIYNSQRFLEYARQYKIDIKANTIRKFKEERARRNEHNEKKPYVDLLSHLEIIRRATQFPQIASLEIEGLKEFRKQMELYKQYTEMSERLNYIGKLFENKNIPTTQESACDTKQGDIVEQ